MIFKSATGKFRKKGPKKSPEEEYLGRVRENITYEQLIERTMNTQKEAQTAIDQTLPVLQRAMNRRQRTCATYYAADCLVVVFPLSVLTVSTGTRLAIQGELDVLAAASEEHLDGKPLTMMVSRPKTRCEITAKLGIF